MAVAHPQLLAQRYVAPLLASVVGSPLAVPAADVAEVRVGRHVLVAVGVLVASLLHVELVLADDLPPALLFGAFVVATVALARLTFAAMTGYSEPAATA